MEARSVPGSGVVHKAPAVDPRLAEDPFFYGYRWVRVKTPDGRTVSEQVPLTRDDLLDPQEDDHVSNRHLHDLITGRYGEMLRTLFRSRGLDDVLVTCNVKMLWAESTIKRVAPDLAVIPGVEKPDERDFTSFDEAQEGTRPSFVLEVLSDATESTDYGDKPGVYNKAKVAEYFTLDQKQTPWVLGARRRYPATSRYRKVRPGQDGRIVSEELELVFEIGEDKKSLVLTDLRTGERLRDHWAAEEGRRQAEEAAKAEAEQRRQAEEATKAEAEGRRQAEEARRQAEEAAKAEAEQRRQAEAETQRLAAEVERLKTLLGKH
jgi:Uma2 family endonuclease